MEKSKKSDYKIVGKIKSNNLVSKKQTDHSLYWKIVINTFKWQNSKVKVIKICIKVVQDYVKKLDSENMEKDSYKQQAIG